MKHSMLLGGVAILSLSGQVAADEAPAPPPSVPDIKACIRQMDVDGNWSFDWKLLEIGSPRHPLNAYEALYAPPGAGIYKTYGYPVHVVYRVNGRADIDAVYWLMRDAGGHWQIPAICTVR
jgi:hypothetical protein